MLKKRFAQICLEFIFGQLVIPYIYLYIYIYIHEVLPTWAGRGMSINLESSSKGHCRHLEVFRQKLIYRKPIIRFEAR